MRPTDITDLLESQDGGSFKEKIEAILSDVAAAVIDHGRTGEIVLKMNLEQISNSSQVNVKSKLTYKRPRPRGEVSESYATVTPMYVNSGGKVTLFAEDQADMFAQRNQQ